MSEEYKKQRYSVWLSKDAVQKSDAAVVMEGLTNRSDFIEKAIHFYSGYLYQEKHMDFLSDVMMETVSGIMRTSENRLSKMLFKIACFSKSQLRWQSWKVCLLRSMIWMRQLCEDFISDVLMK